MKPLTVADFAPGSRWQRTFYVDGCRVLWTRRRSGAFHLRATDPTGDYRHEFVVLARVAALLAEAHVAHGVGINIGTPRIISDHPALPVTTED